MNITWGGKIVLQSSHNFILESLVSFGLIGFLLMIIIVLGICKGLLFSQRKAASWRSALLLIAAIAYVCIWFIRTYYI
jgi:O-antigen ligase